MANFYSNLLDKDKDDKLNSFPIHLNMFDNLPYIQYQGISIPRIPMERDQSINIVQGIYSYKGNIETNENGKKNEGNLWVSIGNNNKEIELFNNININICKKGRTKNSFLSQKKENINKNNYLINSNQFINNKNKINILIKEKQLLEPIPPQSFISIINNETKDNNDLKAINKIISNNIDLILKNISIKNTYLQFSHFNDYNKINNINFLNIESTNYDISKNNDSKTYTFANASKIYKITKFISKKGMKKLDLNRRIHSASDDDNILRKIQVHFLSFIINFTNDVICTFRTDKDIPLFKNLAYKIKKVVNHKFVEQLKKARINEILQFKVSPKMKINDESLNRRIFNIIWDKLPSLHKFLQTNYLNFFKDYYYNINNQKIEVDGIEIKLSIRTKTFNDLINKNYKYKEKIKYVVINYLLNSYKRIKRPNFKTLLYNK